jgi:hypothetical protein
MRKAVTFRWLGAAGIELRAGRAILVVDPFFSRPSLWRTAFGRLEPDRRLGAKLLPACDFVLVTHAHHDHAMDVPQVVLRTGARVWGSTNVCRLMRASGVAASQVQEIQAGDSLAAGPFWAQVLPAEHVRLPGIATDQRALALPPEKCLPGSLSPPQRLRDYQMDRSFSFMIGVGQLRLLVWRSVRAEGSGAAEVLFVQPRGQETFFEVLLAAVRPSLVVPIEWDDPFRPITKAPRPFFEVPGRRWPPVQRINLDRFGAMIERLAPGANVLVPKLLHPYQIEEDGRLAD